MLLQKRKGIYYFRYSYPTQIRQILGRRELCKTLCTRNKLVAQSRSAPFISFVLYLKGLYFQADIYSSADFESLIISAYEQFEKSNKINSFSQIGSSISALTCHPINELSSSQKAVRKEMRASQGYSKSQSRGANNFLLSEAYREFIKSKSLSDKVVKSYDRHIQVLHEIIGNPSVASISKGQLKDALAAIGKLPKKNVAPYNAMTWKELLKLDSISQDHYISPKSVKEHLKFWQSLFAYLRQETEWLKENPTADLKYTVDSRQSSYAAFSHQEVSSILSLSKQSADYWWYILCLLAAYTGARKSELLSLTTEHFKVDDDTGRYYFVVTKAKTPAGLRKVPIAEQIEKEVIQYLSLIPIGEKLFADGNRKSKQFAGIIKSYLDRINKSHLTDTGRRKVFHSFRHTFITGVRSKGVELSLVQSVVGHELSHTGQTQIYTNEYPLSAVLCVVDSVKYDKGFLN